VAEISTRGVAAAGAGALVAVALAFATSSDSSEKPASGGGQPPVAAPQDAGVK
jgi:hypothetical protein